MKLSYLASILAATVVVGFSSCSSDDDINPSQVPAEIKKSFSQMYPSITNPEWESVPPYYVADFDYETFDTEAWFSADGSWAMTETDYNSNVYNLPALMQNAFLDSKYANLMVDDVELYQREFDSFCAIDVEGATGVEMTIYIDSYGDIINVTPDTDYTILPSTVVSDL